MILIEREARHVFQPSLLWLMTGNRTPENISRPVDALGKRGISPEDMPRLFTEGGRGAESTKVNVHSTGYGLFIARSITLAHRGRIWAESPGRGKGSTFMVELPAAIKN